MAEAARRHGITPADGTTYDYRLVAPLFEYQGLIARDNVQQQQTTTAARDTSGLVAARGSILTE